MDGEEEEIYLVIRAREAAQEAFERAGGLVDQFGRKVTSAQEQLDKNTEAFQRHADASRALGQSFEALGNSIRGAKLEEAKKAADAIGQSFATLGQRLQSSGAAAQVRSLSAEAAGLFTQLGPLGVAFGSLIQRAGEFTARMIESDQSVGTFVEGLKKGDAGAIAFTAVLGGLFIAAGRVAAMIGGPLTQAANAWFDDALAGEKAVTTLALTMEDFDVATGKVGARTQELTGFIDEVSHQFGIADTEIKQATISLEQQADQLGLSDEAIKEVIKTATALAAATGKDVGTAVRSVTFGLLGIERPLRSFNVYMKDSEVALHQLGDATGETFGLLNPAQQAVLRMNELLGKTANVERTAATVTDETLGGAIRKTNTEFHRLHEEMGKGIAEVYEPYIRLQLAVVEQMNKLPVPVQHSIGQLTAFGGLVFSGAAKLLDLAGKIAIVIAGLSLLRLAFPGVFEGLALLASGIGLVVGGVIGWTLAIGGLVHMLDILDDHRIAANADATAAAGVAERQKHATDELARAEAVLAGRLADRAKMTGTQAITNERMIKLAEAEVTAARGKVKALEGEAAAIKAAADAKAKADQAPKPLDEEGQKLASKRLELAKQTLEATHAQAQAEFDVQKFRETGVALIDQQFEGIKGLAANEDKLQLNEKERAVLEQARVSRNLQLQKLDRDVLQLEEARAKVVEGPQLEMAQARAALAQRNLALTQAAFAAGRASAEQVASAQAAELGARQKVIAVQVAQKQAEIGRYEEANRAAKAAGRAAVVPPEQLQAARESLDALKLSALALPNAVGQAAAETLQTIAGMARDVADQVRVAQNPVAETVIEFEKLGTQFQKSKASLADVKLAVAGLPPPMRDAVIHGFELTQQVDAAKDAAGGLRDNIEKATLETAKLAQTKIFAELAQQIDALATDLQGLGVNRLGLAEIADQMRDLIPPEAGENAKALRDALDRMSDPAADVSRKMKELREEFAKTVAPDSPALAGFDALAARMTASAAAAAKLKDETGAWVSGLDLAEKTSTEVLSALTSGTLDMGKLGKSIETSLVNSLQQAFVAGLKKKSGFDTDFQVNIFQLMKNVGSIIADPSKGFSSIFDGVFAKVGKDGARIFGQDLPTQVQDGVQKASNAVGVLPTTMEQAAQSSSEALHVIPAGAVDAYTQTAQVAADGAKAISDTGVQAQSGWGGFFSWLVDAGKNAFGALLGVATSTVGAILSVVSQIFGGEGSTIGGAIATAASFVTGLGGGGGAAQTAGAPGVATAAVGTGGYAANFFGGGGVLSATQQVTEFGFTEVAKELGTFRAILGEAGRFLPVIGGLLGVAFGGNPILRAGSGLAAVGGLSSFFPSALPALSGGGFFGTAAQLPIIGSGVQGIANIGALLSKIPGLGPIIAKGLSAVGLVGGGVAGGAAGLGAGAGALAGAATPALGLTTALAPGAGVLAPVAGEIGYGAIAGAAPAVAGATPALSSILSAVSAAMPYVAAAIGAYLAISSEVDVRSGGAPKPGSAYQYATAPTKFFRAMETGNIAGMIGNAIDPGLTAIIELIGNLVGSDIFGMGPTDAEWKKYLSGEFAKSMSKVLGRPVSATGGGRLSREVRGTPGVAGALDILAGASVPTLGNEALRRPDIMADLRKIYSGALSGRDLEQAQKDVRAIVVNYFGNLLAVFRNWNTYLVQAQAEGDATSKLGTKAFAKQREGVEMLGNLYSVAGVKLGDVFARHIAESGRIKIQESLPEVRRLVLAAAEAGATITVKDARHFGDPFLLALAKATKDMPKSIDALGIAAEVAAQGVKDKLDKAGQAISEGAVVLTKRLLFALKIAQQLAEAGLPQLTDEESARVGAAGERAATTARRRDIRAAVTARQTIVAAEQQITAGAEGTTAVYTARQSEDRLKTVSADMDNLIEKLPKLEKQYRAAVAAGDWKEAEKVQKKIKDARDSMQQLAQTAVEAVKAWGDAVMGLINQLHQLDTQIEDTQLSLDLEEAQLRKSTSTHELYANVIDLTKRRLDEQTTAAGKVEVITRILGLLRAQAQAEINDLQEAATKRQEERQKRLEEIGPIAGQATSLRAQLDSVTAIAETPRRALERLQQSFTEQLGKFWSTTGQDQADAASKAQEAASELLQQAANVFGTGSARYRSLRDQIVAGLQPMTAIAEQAAEEAKRIAKQQEADDKATQKAIEKVNRTLADQIDLWEGPLLTAMKAQRGELLGQLRTILTPEMLGVTGADYESTLERLLADPQAAALLIAELQLKQLQDIKRATEKMAGIADSETTTGQRTPLPDLGTPPIGGTPVGIGGTPVDFFARAAGGPVEPFQAYMVGEQGPEPAVFSRSGRVISNAEASELFGQKVEINFSPQIVINPAPGMTAVDAQLFGREAATAAEAEFIKSAKVGRIAQLLRGPVRK